MKKAAVITICVALISQGGAYAHEGEAHHEGHGADAQMQKLHKIMPMYSTTFPKLQAAVEKGDASAAEAEAGAMLATIPDLKKSKPHKNLKQLKTFSKIADAFEKNLKETVELVKKGDVPKAKVAAQKVEATCADCHAKFR